MNAIHGNHKGWLVALALLPGLHLPAQADATSLPERLKTAPVNTWVKLAEDGNARVWPMLVWHPGMEKFLLGAGSGGGGYDQMTFDPATLRWGNLFPEGKTSDPGYKARGPQPFTTDSDGALRLLRHGQIYRDGGSWHQFALAPESGILYAYYHGVTLAFSPETRRWSDLKAGNFARVRRSTPYHLIMGSMAYDPVNREILSVGGLSDDDGGSPGTWAYDIGANKWKRVAVGSEALNALRGRAGELERTAEDLVNRQRNRMHRTETPDEAKADLDAALAAWETAADAFLADLGKAQLEGVERGLPARAAAAFGDIRKQWAAIRAEGAGIRERVISGQATVDALQRAVRILDAEPCGRGASQMAVDPVRGKIVLFGGMRIDSYLGDTWVYDCKTRTWEQRWPERNPAPRFGHTLVWLPKSGRIVLYGANNHTVGAGSRVPFNSRMPPHDLWTYDMDRNAWKLLASEAELKMDGRGTGAAGPDDVLLFVTGNGFRGKQKNERQTLAMKVDTDAPESAAAGKVGVPAGAVTYCLKSPTHYDKPARLEPEKIAEILENLPVNTWTPLPLQSPPCNNKVWGSSAYDSKRHQILFWGGGHSPYNWNDMAHYSLRMSTWSTGYREEFAFPAPGFSAFHNQTFNNRPFYGSHVWDTVAYDPTLDRLVGTSRSATLLYDPATRRWDYPFSPPPPGLVDLANNTAETPGGVVQWSGDGKLYRFDSAARAWKALPMPPGVKSLGRPFSDKSGLCYDSRRNALWIGVADGHSMRRYDIETGQLRGFSTRGAEGVYMRETVYVPALDMLVNVGRIAGAGGKRGNAAYDIEANKWVCLNLPFSDGKERASPYHTLGLHYDTALDLLLYNVAHVQVVVGRIDKDKLEIFELPAPPPPVKKVQDS